LTGRKYCWTKETWLAVSGQTKFQNRISYLIAPHFPKRSKKKNKCLSFFSSHRMKKPGERCPDFEEEAEGFLICFLLPCFVIGENRHVRATALPINRLA